MNAEPLISVTVFGIVIDVKAVAPEKDSNPILVTKDGRVNMTEFKFVADWNALLPISVTFEAIITEDRSITETVPE